MSAKKGLNCNGDIMLQAQGMVCSCLKHLANELMISISVVNSKPVPHASTFQASEHPIYPHTYSWSSRELFTLHRL